MMMMMMFSWKKKVKVPTFDSRKGWKDEDVVSCV